MFTEAIHNKFTVSQETLITVNGKNTEHFNVTASGLLKVTEKLKWTQIFILSYFMYLHPNPPAISATVYFSM
jgi:hypothetical protein